MPVCRLASKQCNGGWQRRRSHVVVAAAATLLMVFATWQPSSAASLNVGGGARVDVPLQSFKDLRDKGVVLQTYDYSCGAATLATLMTYAFNDPVGEREAIEGMLQALDDSEEELRKKKGFSLLDMQHFAEARGYKAQGFRLDPRYLPDISGPTIVYVRPRGYDHFVVLKGVRGDRAYVADPSLGNVRMPLYAFLESWLDEAGKGIVFVVEPRTAATIAKTLLSIAANEEVRPELLGIRQLLEVGLPP